ncbi:MAG: hypothetical protein N2322_01310 [Terrimicrobiaceae bacterium]|nr:hypothetical protein [Terrimicrobiaceae bacterium]
MPASPASTTEKLGGLPVRQFTVFLQNKVGALLEVVKLLDHHNVVVLALSIQDSTESALARMIVSDPDRAADLFREMKVPFGECEVLVVELPGGASDLAKMLALLLAAEVNIIFSYPLLTRPRGRTAIALHADDTECAAVVLGRQGFPVLAQDDISR